MSDKKNKFYITTELKSVNALTEKSIKEKASILNLPKETPRDLLYMSAILVSTGTNKNGATFLGSELIKARETIKLKALDIEHEEQDIIGHIVGSVFFTQDGEILDDESLHADLLNKKENAKEYAKAVAELDSQKMDVGILCVVYKDRFPEIAEEIKEGKWQVSMETYYEDFDIKIGSKIVNKETVANHSGLNNIVGLDQKVGLVLSSLEHADHQVSRVLRDLHFCGCGIVKDPANSRSIILEAASVKTNEVLDSGKLEEQVKEVPGNVLNVLTNQTKRQVLEQSAVGFMLAKKESSHKLEIVEDSYFTDFETAQEEAIKRTSLSSNEEECFIVINLETAFSKRDPNTELEKLDANLYQTDDIGKIEQVVTLGSKKEESTVRRYGPADRSSGICASFAKYVHQYPGYANPGRVVATHWCKLFNKPCPVIGASAQSPSCLRHRYVKLGPGNLHDYDTVLHSMSPEGPSAYNTDIEIISNQELPKKAPSNEVIDNLVEDYELYDKPKIVENNETEVHERRNNEIESQVITTTEEVEQFESHKPSLIDEYRAYEDFFSLVPSLPSMPMISMMDRASLHDDEFAIKTERKFPLATKEQAERLVHSYKSLERGITSYSKKQEFFNNLVIACLKFDIDTVELEKKSLFSFSPEEKEFSSEYAVPRLKLLPLDSKEQVISAIGKVPCLKVELTDREKAFLYINIARAAKVFGVDVSNFRALMFIDKKEKEINDKLKQTKFN